MAKTRAFLYNTGATIPGTDKIGDVTAGDPTAGIGASGGGFWWRGGPDEDLGYIIAKTSPGPKTAGGGTEILPGTGLRISFMRSLLKTDASFLNLVNGDLGQSWTTATEAKTWLNANGMWTSFGEALP